MVVTVTAMIHSMGVDDECSVGEDVRTKTVPWALETAAGSFDGSWTIGQLRRQRIQSFYKRAFNLSVGGLDLDAARRAGGDSGEEGCGRSEWDDSDRRRETVAFDSDGGNAIHPFTKARFCKRHGFLVEVEGTWAGSEGHGTVGYAAAVDAAIDAIVGRGLACSTDREAWRMMPDSWQVAGGHAMTFTFECPKIWGGRRWRTKTVAAGAGYRIVQQRMTGWTVR
jgi:hypothetical protein